MWQISAGLGIALVLASGAFKMYYDRAEAEKQALQTQLQVAVNNQQILENTIEGQNQQLLDAVAAQEKQAEQMRGLEQKNQQANEEVSSLRMKFAKHDLNHLSLRKPGLIENIINKATKEVGNDLAEITNPNRDP
jgi:hypothetical protein